MQIEVFGHTDRGKKRRYNEDNYICLDVSLPSSEGKEAAFLLAVADGMGGHAGGHLASSMAIDILKKSVFDPVPISYQPDPQAARLEAFFHKANQEIFTKAASDERLRGMGTTLVACLVLENHATVANVGDSRLYLIRNGSLQQITHDHSWRAEQLQKDLLSEREIAESPFKNMITRSLGYEPEIKADIFHIELEFEDYLMLCTDGLYGSLTESQILKTFHKQKRPVKICQKLVKLANRFGGNDNITGVVLQCRDADEPDRKGFHPSDTVKLDDIET